MPWSQRDGRKRLDSGVVHRLKSPPSQDDWEYLYHLGNRESFADAGARSGAKREIGELRVHTLGEPAIGLETLGIAEIASVSMGNALCSHNDCARGRVVVRKSHRTQRAPAEHPGGRVKP